MLCLAAPRLCSDVVVRSHHVLIVPRDVRQVLSRCPARRKNHRLSLVVEDRNFHPQIHHLLIAAWDRCSRSRCRRLSVVLGPLLLHVWLIL